MKSKSKGQIEFQGLTLIPNELANGYLNKISHQPTASRARLQREGFRTLYLLKYFRYQFRFYNE